MMGIQKYSGFDFKAHEDNPNAHHPAGALDPPDDPAARYIPFTLGSPNGWQIRDNEVSILPGTPAALTITRLQVTLDAITNQVQGDVMYADAFIGQANSNVIVAFDTTLGVLDTGTISAAVPAGKCLYLSFDSAPDADITQMNMMITFTFD
jgi:hypothetical protein